MPPTHAIRAAVLPILAVALLANSLWAQTTPPPAPPTSTESPQQRKDQLAADTAKLLKLATELKAAVDKSTKDQLSVAVIKKADEVEKLAHKVREEIRTIAANGSDSAKGPTDTSQWRSCRHQGSSRDEGPIDSFR